MRKRKLNEAVMGGGVFNRTAQERPSGKNLGSYGTRNIPVTDVVGSVFVWPGEESRQGRCGFTIPVYPLVTEA